MDIVLACTAAALLRAFILLTRRRQPRGVTQGSMGLPFVGETLAFLKPHNSSTPGEFLEDRCRRYGNVFKSHLFGRPAIVSCDLGLNNFVLQNEGRLFESSYPKAMHSILGKSSLLLITGDLHKKIRSIAIGFISASKSKPSFLLSIQKQSSMLLKESEQLKQIAFHKEAKKFAFNLTVELFLGIGPEEAVTKTMQQDFLTFMEGFISLPLSIPGTTFSRALHARGRLCKLVKEMLREKEGGAPGGEDFLNVILKTDLSDDQKVTCILDLLLASHETTATLMALILYFLEGAPKVVKELQDENQSLIDEKGAGSHILGWEDYRRMPFTQCVINEALRLGNVVKFVHRKAIKEVKYKDYVIPSGWKVLPIFTSTHVDPTLHDDPTTFNPWRWMDNDSMKKVTPFGGGLRLCPGSDIARVEISFFLHHLVLSYGWKRKEDEHPLSLPYVDFPKGLLLHIYKKKA